MPSLAGLNLTGAHYGVNADASTAIALIALSRLARAKDAVTLARVAASPFGATFLLVRGILPTRKEMSPHPESNLLKHLPSITPQGKF